MELIATNLLDDLRSMELVNYRDVWSANLLSRQYAVETIEPGPPGADGC
jgi:hypothetical protein